jgi:hypothetical protein
MLLIFPIQSGGVSAAKKISKIGSETNQQPIHLQKGWRRDASGLSAFQPKTKQHECIDRRACGSPEATQRNVAALRCGTRKQGAAGSGTNTEKY